MRQWKVVAVPAFMAGMLAIWAPGLTGQSEGLGMVSFPNSGVAEAQPAFLRGVLLLHNFEYEDAAAQLPELEEARALVDGAASPS